MTKLPTNIGDSTVVYTTNSGDKVALPAGDGIKIGDTVLVHKLSDGSFMTHGNSEINIGDTVLVGKMANGELIAVTTGDFHNGPIGVSNYCGYNIDDPTLGVDPNLSYAGIKNTAFTTQEFPGAWVLTYLGPELEEIDKQAVDEATAIVNQNLGYNETSRQIDDLIRQLFAQPWLHGWYQYDLYWNHFEYELPYCCSIHAGWNRFPGVFPYQEIPIQINWWSPILPAGMQYFQGSMSWGNDKELIGYSHVPSWDLREAYGPSFPNNINNPMQQHSFNIDVISGAILPDFSVQITIDKQVIDAAPDLYEFQGYVYNVPRP